MLDKSQNHRFYVVVDLLFALAAKKVTTPQEQQVHHEQRCTFIAVNKPMVGCQRLNECGNLLGD
jgi:hypothetical protein